MMGRSEWWWTLSVDRRTITWLISLSPGLMVATRVVYQARTDGARKDAVLLGNEHRPN